ncbi:MAG: hypothetical protein JW827_05290 [Spirochaetes bacterium]|nr:hypothetical protein [Spirochaetota bacterium]
MKVKLILITLMFFMFLTISVCLGYSENGIHTNINVFNVPGTVNNGSSAGMGLPSILLEDDYNSFNNPSQLMQYGTAYGELWSGNAWGGATFVLFGIKFGVFLGRPYEGYAPNFMNWPDTVTGSGSETMNLFLNNYQNAGNITAINNNPGLTGGAVLTPVNHADFFTGIKFDSMAIGAKFTYADNSDSVEFESIESPTNTAISNFGKVSKNRSVADHHITLGFLFFNFGPFRTLDVSFDLGLLSFENSYKENGRKDNRTAENIWQSDNNPTLRFLLRPIMDLGIGTLIVPVSLTLIDTSSKGTRRHDLDGNGLFTDAADRNDGFTLEDKQTDLIVDLALHTKPTKELKVIYATGLNSSKREKTSTINSNLGTANKISERSETTSLTIPFGISVEHQTLSWLLLRFGAHKIIFVNNEIKATDENYQGNVIKNTITSTTSDQRDITNEFQISLGIGMRPLSKVDIDWALNAAVNQTYTFNNIVSRLSLKYHY